MSKDIFEMVKELNIVDIIEDYINIGKKQGKEYMALCPFHNDTRLGSFLINPEKGKFKCFACGKGGDGIDFVSLYENISPVEAAARIALSKGLINIVEYENRIYNIGDFQYERLKEEPKIKKYKRRNNRYILNEIKLKANNHRLDKAYNIFLENLELKEEHREHLLKERQIPLSIIEKRKYRTYPTCEEAKVIFDKLHSEFGDLDNIFKGVPGFYKKKIGDRWEWKMKYNRGIIIPIRNAKEQIIALHLKVDKENKNGMKYKWISSKDHIYTTNTRFGVSSSAPLDVIYPEQRPNNVLFITEGRFKSEVIVNEINSTCISVQGIGNWRGIEREIYETEDYLKQKYDEFLGFTRIYIAFDMDIYTRLEAHQQLKKMSDFIQNQFLIKEIYYIEWDKTYKGIDDFILNNKRNKLEDYGKLFKLTHKEIKDREMEDKI